jgi:hypothetical protein
MSPQSWAKAGFAQSERGAEGRVSGMCASDAGRSSDGRQIGALVLLPGSLSWTPLRSRRLSRKWHMVGHGQSVFHLLIVIFLLPVGPALPIRVHPALRVRHRVLRLYPGSHVLQRALSTVSSSFPCLADDTHEPPHAVSLHDRNGHARALVFDGFGEHERTRLHRPPTSCRKRATVCMGRARTL